ncbi:MAG: hypothetical protein ACRDFX_04215 [Chloroflexota bacterium]
MAASTHGGKTSGPHQRGYIGQHHLRARASKTAFVFGNYGGFALSLTTVITDGSLVIDHSPVSGRRRFQAPFNTARGLLKLAEALGFFRLGNEPSCPAHAPGASGDVTIDYITIHTKHYVVRVDSPGACNAAFAELFAVLNAVARYSA